MKRILIAGLLTVAATAAFLPAGKKYADGTVATKAEREYLLKLSRRTLEKYVRETDIPHVDPAKLSTNLTSLKGCFVTLNKKGSGLRGCIGNLQPVKPLYQSTIDNTISAAVRDHRFQKVTARELEKIKISISILTVPEPLAFSSPQDLLDKLTVGRDGVILKTRYGSSTYLPSVWDDLSDKKTFLSRLCMKHGAPHDEWRKGEISVQTYRAVKFEEKKFGGD